MTCATAPTRERAAKNIRPAYDFIVCGGGTAGCAIARRLSDDPAVSVLLIEAGGSDQVPSVIDTTLWMSNIGSERDWGYRAQRSLSLNGRMPPLPMGRVLGGGSSINGSIWARGHKNDFDGWAEASGDPGWNYDAALAIYRRIEDWQGPPDAVRRGTGGILNIVQPDDPVPLVSGLTDGAAGIGIPPVADINGAAMEGDGGCGLANILVQDGNRRVSMAASYLYPVMDRRNLDILLCTQITGRVFAGERADGVRFVHRGRTHEVICGQEVVLSLGAINTPKLLMLGGIGDEIELRAHAIAVRAPLRGVGRNFQDHILLAGCCWEYVTPERPRNNAAEFVFYAKSRSELPTPDLMPVLEECPFGSEVTGPRYALPQDAAAAWTLASGLARPDSRGEVRPASADPMQEPVIDANFLSTDSDVAAMLLCIEMCREIGNSAACAPFVRRELMPGALGRSDMVQFLRDGAGTYFHQCGTARMGRDGDGSVVNNHLLVHGIERLRVADASIMPTVATGNTMAPTVVIAERAADLLIAAHRLSPV